MVESCPKQEEAVMNRITSSILVVVLGLMVGCGTAGKTIIVKSQSERADVFQEISVTEAIPAGYADLMIRASIKTHVEGYYGEEPKESAHGKETYPFLINIDGQAVLWKVAGKKHELPLNVNGITSRDPEAGSGIKYILEKRVRLAAGTHRVFFGLPEEPYYTEADIAVASGSTNVLEFKPKYWHKHVSTRIPTFFKGINKYDVVLNGSIIR